MVRANHTLRVLAELTHELVNGFKKCTTVISSFDLLSAKANHTIPKRCWSSWPALGAADGAQPVAVVRLDPSCKSITATRQQESGGNASVPRPWESSAASNKSRLFEGAIINLFIGGQEVNRRKGRG